MRLFIAVPIADNVRSVLVKLIRHLRASGADYKWVEPENLHVTMAFLGGVQEDRLGVLKKVMQEAAVRKPFTLTLGGPGAFESRGRSRVLWVGLAQGGPELAELAAALNAGLAREGFKVEERPFAAHITIGRMRSQKNSAAFAVALADASAAPHAATCTAGRVTLIESKLAREGPTYTPVHEERFRA